MFLFHFNTKFALSYKIINKTITIALHSGTFIQTPTGLGYSDQLTVYLLVSYVII